MTEYRSLPPQSSAHRDGPSPAHGSAPIGAVDTLLHALGDAAPAAGFEQRLLQRLAAESVHSYSATREFFFGGRRWAWATAGLLAACGVGAALSVHVAQRHGAGLAPRSVQTASVQRATSHSTADTLHPLQHEPVPATARPASIRATNERPAGGAVSLHLLRTRGPVLASRSAPSARLARALTVASFPAPEMPLTEQERLLIAIAHRNDPVQIAMLDPVAREAKLQRERAADDRFFAPKPLPPELQSQIIAALRSQYVNTPVPPELRAESNPRSLP